MCVMFRFVSIITLLIFSAVANAKVHFNNTTELASSTIIAYSQKEDALYFANDLIGASAWYNVGVYGAGANVANVELGIRWDGHIAFSNTSKGEVFVPDGASVESLYHDHATATSGVISGYQMPDNTNTELELQIYAAFGVAPLSTLSDGAVARKISSNGTAELTGNDFERAYKHFFETNSQDVISSSWGPLDDIAGAYSAAYVDALSYKNKYTTLAIAAGNATIGSTLARPTSFAQSYNAISVGALDNSPEYNEIADFSLGSPTDFYNPITQTTIKNVRPAVDICAPGVDIFVPYYDSSDTTTNNMYAAISGTSVSTPLVSGTVALMASLSKELEARSDFVQAGWSADARDSRVIKAVLMNSADKPADWDNGQSIQDNVEVKLEISGIQGFYAVESFNGVIKTTQGLDFNYGAGALNAERALEQYVGLYTTGTLNNVWLLDEVDFCASKLYHIGEINEGSTLTMTLVWQAIYELVETTDTLGNTTESIVNPALSDLALELWIQLADGTFMPVAISDTKYNNVEHLSVTLAGVADYYVRVAFFDTSYGDVPTETYALAWNIVTAIPEPAEWAIVIGAIALFFAVRRKRK